MRNRTEKIGNIQARDEKTLGKKIKICHFTYSFFPTVGGMEEVIHNLSLSMRSNDFEPYVFAPSVRGRDNRVSAPYRILRYSRPSSRRFGLRQLLIPLLWHHWRYHFDVLHCHSVYPTGYVGAAFHKITGIPFVITPHGGDITKNNRGNIINRKVTDRIRKTFASAQAVTAISSALRQQILDLGAPPEKVFLVPNGVSLGEFTQIDASKKNLSSNSIVFIGRLIRRKAADILIQACSLVKYRCPDIKIKIAGEGPEMYSLKEMVKNLCLTQEVELLGTVRGEKKTRLLAEALFLVCPSREEPFGIVNLEALASGLPVIATKVGGIPDIIQDGISGFLIDSGNPEQLAEKMHVLIEDPALRIRMSENALNSVSRYDWSKVVQDFQRIYGKIRRS